MGVLEARLGRTRAWMASSGLTALVVWGGPRALGSSSTTAGNVRYITGWMSRSTPAVVVLTTEGPGAILTIGPHDTRAFEMRSSWLGDVVKAGSVALYADRAGGALRGAGVGPGDVVGLVGSNEMPLVAY